MALNKKAVAEQLAVGAHRVLDAARLEVETLIKESVPEATEGVSHQETALFTNQMLALAILYNQNILEPAE